MFLAVDAYENAKKLQMSHVGSWVSSNFALLLKNRKKIHQSCAQNYPG